VNPLTADSRKIVVLVFLRRDCPVSSRYAPVVQRISQQYADRATFWLVYPDKSDSPQEIRKYLRDYGYNLPALQDPAHALAKFSRVQITPELAVFNRDRQLIYDGRIDDWYVDLGRARPAPTTHELNDAIEAALSGKPIANSESGEWDATSPTSNKLLDAQCSSDADCDGNRRFGDYPLWQAIAPLSSNPSVTPPAQVTFNRNIAPIVFHSCSTCHRPGEAAPFSLLNYADVKKHARQIADVTHSRAMPPWLPEPQKLKFADELRLSDAEINLIKTWVEQGSVEGNPADLPPPPKFVEGWRLGEPDLVLTANKPLTLPPQGTDTYWNFIFPVPIQQTRWVKAIEIRPGDKR
jgi:mono/diheme cytochrome c family protein